MQSAISAERPIARNRSLSVAFAAVAHEASKASASAAETIRIEFLRIKNLPLPVVADVTMRKMARLRKPNRQENR